MALPFPSEISNKFLWAPRPQGPSKASNQLHVTAPRTPSFTGAPPVTSPGLRWLDGCHAPCSWDIPPKPGAGKPFGCHASCQIPPSGPPSGWDAVSADRNADSPTPRSARFGDPVSAPGPCSDLRMLLDLADPGSIWGSFRSQCRCIYVDMCHIQYAWRVWKLLLLPVFSCPLRLAFQQPPNCID